MNDDEAEDRVDRALSVMLRRKDIEIIQGPDGEKFKLTEQGKKNVEELLRTNPAAREFLDNLRLPKQ